MNRVLRFCMLATFYPPASFGGDAIQVERLAVALAERGHEVTVVHSQEAYEALRRRRGSAGGGGDPRVRVVSVDVGTGPLSPLAAHLTGRPLLTRRALERVLGERFDVLHFHNPALLGAPGALRLGRSVKLYTAHEQWLVCPTHVLWKYKRRVCERPTCLRCSLTYARPPQLWRSGSILERGVQALDALILPSRASVRLHERFAPLVRLEHIPHFVPRPAAAAGDGVPQRPYFLFAGRLESIKGAEVAIDAFRGRPEELLVAGSGTLEDSLRQRAADLPNVHFLGWVSPERLGTLYRGALAVVVPTLGHEAFGLVAAEALARGTPAIVHAFGALGELVEDSGGGLGYRTEAELQEALDRVAGDHALRERLAARGRAAYVERWTPEAHLRRYFLLVAELAESRGDADLAAAARGAAPEPQAAIA
jgi:glycosyltransferase involved in cell wall biosynthesis